MLYFFKMKPGPRSFLALLVCLLIQTPAFCWGPEGHRLVSRIAAQHLTPKARKKVFNLLKNDPKAGVPLHGKTSSDINALGEAMAIASTWADEIKSIPRGQGTRDWHFLDLAATDTASDIPSRCPGGDCITAKLVTLQANIPGKVSLPNGPLTYTPAEELKFLIHFMGDLHQPLHCSTDADAGGNCRKTTGLANNLHAAWDGGLVKKLNTDSSGNPIGEQALASSLDSDFSPSFASLTALTAFEDMALESKTISFASVYQPIFDLHLNATPEPRPFARATPPACTDAPPDLTALPPLDLTPVYGTATVQVVREQLAKGGFRLASTLNTIFQ